MLDVKTRQSRRIQATNVYVSFNMPIFDRELMYRLVDVEIRMERLAMGHGMTLDFIYLPFPHVRGLECEPSDYVKESSGICSA